VVTGRELKHGTLKPARSPKKVLIAGGGPAGLKAAAVAAQRGHDVTLYEAGRRLGGQVLLAERIPGRAEFGGAITNLTGEAERAGARLVTGVRVDAGLIEREAPDAVIIATGARPRTPEIELMDDPVVTDAWDVIKGAAVPAGHIVVADWRGDWIGLGVALLLAQSRRRVTLTVTGYGAGEQLQQYVRSSMLADAHRAKMTIIPNTRLYGADADTVYLQHTLTEEPVLVEDVAALVLAQGSEPVTDLLDDDTPGGVTSIGDCLVPRTVEEAVLEGLRAAESL
jgi:NADPH-dependent 2,4-dienoyl-CoA reductase/sulfur reductase-like enzyme